MIEPMSAARLNQIRTLIKENKRARAMLETWYGMDEYARRLNNPTIAALNDLFDEVIRLKTLVGESTQ